MAKCFWAESKFLEKAISSFSFVVLWFVDRPSAKVSWLSTDSPKRNSVAESMVRRKNLDSGQHCSPWVYLLLASIGLSIKNK